MFEFCQKSVLIELSPRTFPLRKKLILCSCCCIIIPLLYNNTIGAQLVMLLLLGLRCLARHFSAAEIKVSTHMKVLWNFSLKSPVASIVPYSVGFQPDFTLVNRTFTLENLVKIKQMFWNGAVSMVFILTVLVWLSRSLKMRLSMQLRYNSSSHGPKIEWNAKDQKSWYQICA